MMAKMEVHTAGLSWMWQIHLEYNADTPRTFELKRRGVTIATGVEWDDDNEWAVTSYVHQDLRAVVDDVMDGFREHRRCQLKRVSHEFLDSLDKCDRNRVKAALAAVFGEGK